MVSEPRLYEFSYFTLKTHGARRQIRANDTRILEFVLSMLSDSPIPWNAILRSAEARSVASEGTLNSIRMDLAKAGRIVTVGQAKKAKWILGASGEDTDVE